MSFQIVKHLLLNGALSVGGGLRMSGLLEADRFLQAVVLAQAPSLNTDQPGLNVSTFSPRGSGCSLWSSVLPSAHRYIINKAFLQVT